MAPRADGKQMSAGFAVFLISFLVLTTLIVFAVLLFLSYENMYNNLILRVEHSTQAAANDLFRVSLSNTRSMMTEQIISRIPESSISSLIPRLTVQTVRSISLTIRERYIAAIPM